MTSTSLSFSVPRTKGLVFQKSFGARSLCAVERTIRFLIKVALFPDHIMRAEPQRLQSGVSVSFEDEPGRVRCSILQHKSARDLSHHAVGRDDSLQGPGVTREFFKVVARELLNPGGTPNGTLALLIDIKPKWCKLCNCCVVVVQSTVCSRRCRRTSTSSCPTRAAPSKTVSPVTASSKHP